MKRAESLQAAVYASARRPSYAPIEGPQQAKSVLADAGRSIRIFEGFLRNEEMMLRKVPRSSDCDDIKVNDIHSGEQRVLMVASHFPPVLDAGCARPLYFAKYLPEFGFKPIVLTRHPDAGSTPSA